MVKKDVRELKVIDQSGYRYKSTPTIMLKGQWLQEWGFEIGDKVAVKCENGRIIIYRKENLGLD